ncbi:hypothetical protein [Algoriphagus mannitolivorans]|uniref:hypothetical protein n=1 Tax=Algoriphagus mannitolivorans TaxID=226504 RepID=UPI00068697A3|nr:hypothetical protein [Algoriphagus mannitolivorans]
MKKVFALAFILIGFALSAKSQDIVSGDEKLTFESEVEKTLWQKGQEDVFQLFLAVEASESTSSSNWEKLVIELDELASKNQDELKLLRQIFQKTHQRILKKYEIHSSFSATLNSGKYDCVSGSAALAILLDRYRIEYDIIETDYHVFLVAKIDGKEIILESTLPVGGMITSPSEVANYLKSYTAANEAPLREFNQRLAGPQVDYKDNSIFRKVNLRELAGLQYYNHAIVQFNSQAFGKAVHQLSKAYLLYPSERIEGLRELSIDLAFKTYGYKPSR